MSETDRGRIHAIVLRGLGDAARRIGLDPDSLGEDTDVLRAGIIDSLGLVDLLVMVETELGVPLALERLDFERVDTLGALVDQLDGLRLGATADGLRG